MENLLANYVLFFFLFSAIWNLLISRFFNVDKTVLYCGIFGFSGKVGKKADLKKLKMLGVYNIQRGTDSCGYYYSGNIKKGVDKNANFTKFIDGNEIERGDLLGEVFIGHTRKSTFGANTENNAHPHQIGNYVQTHNGTIKEPWKLCEKYGVDHKKIQVDSIGLAHIIEKHGFEVLNKYEGYAALAMTFMDDSESLYLYHGASREKENGEVWEERPLYILKQPEGIYYSSLEESLNFISCNKNKAETLPYNCVFKIVNGVMTDYEYNVDRENNNVVKTTYNYNNGYYYKPTDYANSFTHSPAQKEIDFPKAEGGKKELSILLEDYPDEFILQDIYYRRGRFYKDENVLLNGKYLISRDGVIINKDTNTTDRVKETYYFVRGVMIASENLYKKLIENEQDALTNLNKNTPYFLSKYSRYPITAIESEGLLIGDSIKSLWYKDEKVYTGSFTPKFSKRMYKLDKGVLKSISNSTCNTFLDVKPQDYKDVLDIQIVDTPPEDCCSIVNKHFEKVVEIIQDYSNKPIEEDIKELPEAFLKYIDAYVYTYLPDLTDAQVEAETTSILKDLLKLQISFNEYLHQYRDEHFIRFETIFDIFKDEDCHSILLEENRYNFLSFVDTEEFKSKLEKLLPVLEELSKKADELQTLDSDEAQDIAYNIYQSLDVINGNLKDLKDKEEYKSLFKKDSIF